MLRQEQAEAAKILGQSDVHRPGRRRRR
jgi:hypothetical protein